MKALVTGGCGFIGSNLAQSLLTSGNDVTVLDDFSSGYRQNLPEGNHVRLVEGDVRDERAVIEATRGAEVVFHLAAAVGNKRSIEHPRYDADVNVLGTLRVLEAARALGVRKVVFSSSAGIFGEPRKVPIAEDHSVEPDSPYGATKLCAEKLCLAYAKLYDLEAVCLRYFNVYGPNQRFDAYGNVIPIFVFQMLSGDPVTVFGDGFQTRDFLNVNDVVAANIRAAEAHGVSRAFNIGSGSTITINDLVEQCRRLTSTSSKIEFGPPRAGDVRTSLADITAARSALGFDPRVPLETGLPQYVAWAREELARSA